ESAACTSSLPPCWMFALETNGGPGNGHLPEVQAQRRCRLGPAGVPLHYSDEPITKRPHGRELLLDLDSVSPLEVPVIDREKPVGVDLDPLYGLHFDGDPQVVHGALPVLHPVGAAIARVLPGRHQTRVEVDLRVRVPLDRAFEPAAVPGLDQGVEDLLAVIRHRRRIIAALRRAPAPASPRRGRTRFG